MFAFTHSYFNILFAQNKNIDSLLFLLKTDKEDTTKLIHLYQISDEYEIVGDYPVGLNYGKLAVEFADVILKKANIKKLLNFAKRYKARAYNNIGIIYKDQGNYSEALINYFASLKIMEEMDIKSGIASSFCNIGDIYQKQKNYSDALKNYLASLKIMKALNDKESVAVIYNNIGGLYKEQGNYKDAFNSYFFSLTLFKELNDRSSIAELYNNIGIIKYHQGDFTEALKNYFVSLKILESIDNKVLNAAIKMNIGNVFIKQKKYNDAEKYFNTGMQLSKILGYKEWIKNFYSCLTELDSARGNYRGAYENHKLFILYRDSLDNEETRKKTIQTQMTYDFEKKETATKAEQDKKDAIVQASLIKVKFEKYIITGTALIILLASIILIVLNNGKHKIKQLEQRHELRKNIADDLHDEIGAGLTKITMICENGKAGLRKHNPVDIVFLDSISAQSRTISENLNEVIWATHPQNDNLLSLVSNIRSYSSNFLENSSIHYTLNFPDEIKSFKTNPNVNRNLFLIVKETLNNCVKHSKTDMVGIHFSLEKNKNYILKIKDNGIGFSASAIHEKGNGLRTLKNRASAINAAFKLTSEINEGTEIKVTGCL